MYNEIIQNEKEDVQIVQKFAGKSEESIERMEGLIQNLMKITKLDAGTIMLEKEDYNTLALQIEEYAAEHFNWETIISRLYQSVKGETGAEIRQ